MPLFGLALVFFALSLSSSSEAYGSDVCQFYRIITLSDSSSETIVLNFTGSSYFSVNSSFNESNFTFTDSSNSKLNFTIDYLTGSKTESQQVRFFVNVSGLSQARMFYDCNYAASQDVQTNVMVSNFDFESGVQGAFCSGSSSVQSVNDSSSSFIGGRRSGNALKVTIDSSGNSCFSNAVSYSKPDFLNVETLTRPFGNTSQFASEFGTFSSGSKQIQTRFDPVVSSWWYANDTGSTLYNNISTTVETADFSMYNRLAFRSNLSQTNPPVSFYLNGGQEIVRNGAFNNLVAFVQLTFKNP